MQRLNQCFYDKTALEMAPALLGKFLCRRINGTVLKLKITETECYMGQEDTACHAHRGKTERNSIMYERGGKAYIYLCYGIHSLLNIVAGKENSPQAVLIRGVENANGPGKLTKKIQIDCSLNGENLVVSQKLWIENNIKTPLFKAHPRVGIDYATEEYRLKPWRFTLI